MISKSFSMVQGMRCLSKWPSEPFPIQRFVYLFIAMAPFELAMPLVLCRSMSLGRHPCKEQRDMFDQTWKPPDSAEMLAAQRLPNSELKVRKNRPPAEQKSTLACADSCAVEASFVQSFHVGKLRIGAAPMTMNRSAM